MRSFAVPPRPASPQPCAAGLDIALIGHLKYPIAEPFAGGLEMHTHMVARQLQQRGHRVTLFAAEGSDPRFDLRAVCAPTGDGIGNRRVVEEVALTELDAYRAIMERIAAGRFDIVHNNALHYLPLVMAHCLRVPMLTVFHTPPFHELENGVRDRSGAAMRFVAVSESVRAIWQPIVAVDAVVQNGIDLDLFVYQPVAAPEPYAIWSGRLVPEKGPHLAIEAARRAGMPLRLAGPLSNEAYWREAIEPQLGGDITYLGHLGHTALARQLGGARVALCTPRWEEPYGLVVAEALACGTPVAGFARGALPEIVDARCGALAPADDTEALAAALRAAAGLARADCRRRAEAICNSRVMVGRYEAMYRDMLAPAEAARPSRASVSVSSGVISPGAISPGAIPSGAAAALPEARAALS